MGEPGLRIRRDVEEFDPASYEAAAEQYVRHARTLPFVRAVYTFGGINDPGISDLDLLVEFREPATRPAKRFFGLLHSIEDALACQVDLVALPGLRNPYFRKRVLEERVPLYEG